MSAGAVQIEVAKRTALDVGGCSACEHSAADQVQIATVRLSGQQVRLCRGCSARLSAELAKVWR